MLCLIVWRLLKNNRKKLTTITYLVLCFFVCVYSCMDEWLERYKRSLGIVTVAVLVASGGLYVLGPLLLRRLIKKWPPLHVALVVHFSLDFRGGTVAQSVVLSDCYRH